MLLVAIGGGTGLSTLLRGLKNFDVDIVAIVTVTDEGGSSGILRREYRIPPPGDVRNNIVALAEDESLIAKLLQYRFDGNGSLAGHSLGNLMLAALTKMLGSFPRAIEALSDILAIKGRVLPVTDEMVRLVAIKSNGETIIGEEAISKREGRVEEIKLDKSASALDEVVENLEKADMIVVGPGSLYTSVIANFLIDGVGEAIRGNSRAVKIYVANIMTQPGETEGYTLYDHYKEVVKYSGVKFDVVLVNSQPPPQDVLKRYRKEKADMVSIDFERFDIPVILEPMVALVTDERDGKVKVRHDPMKLAEAVLNFKGWKKQ